MTSFKKNRLHNRQYHNKHADNEGVQIEKEKLNMCRSGATSMPTIFLACQDYSWQYLSK
jgi:hypothetical protein